MIQSIWFCIVNICAIINCRVINLRAVYDVSQYEFNKIMATFDFFPDNILGNMSQTIFVQCLPPTNNIKSKTNKQTNKNITKMT